MMFLLLRSRIVIGRYWLWRIVAGSAEFSREGSRVAVNTVGEYLKAFMQKQSGESDRLLAQWQIRAMMITSKNAAHQLGNQFSDAFYSAATQAIEQIEHGNHSTKEALPLNCLLQHYCLQWYGNKTIKPL